ncbi:HEAT repeat domain-containing protein [Lacibacter sediminis]|uniref:HEAT repeat domain-containing protein n=1 Tax=Lacibacter sediminis TaxID=2760713 RepID=A0A7G5XL38_9BACT|nr:hypothetical protein [Lacibacter sediminis]QNA46191.1 hypothetical protein H4075_08420 [Lacibacter sediminis]
MEMEFKMAAQQVLDVFIQPVHLMLAMFIFIAIITVVIFFILVYLIRRTARSYRRAQLRETYSSLISELALCETENELQEFLALSSTQEQLHLLLNDAYSRKVLVSELLKTVKNMSGTAALNICWFYEKAGLDNDSLTRLQEGAWHVKARAIQELSGLQQKKYITKIYRLTNHPDELVRNEARTAVVKLTGFDGLRFLDVVSYPLTEWQQLCLLYELSLHGSRAFEQAPRWLQSKNNSVVEFTLRLVEVYKLYELYPNVIACLHHPAKIVRKKALAALNEIYDSTANELLVEMYTKEDADVQVQILKLLQEHGGEAEQFFLLQQLIHPQQEIKVAAARAIFHTQPEAERLLKQQVDEESYPWTVLLPQLKQEVAL